MDVFDMFKIVLDEHSSRILDLTNSRSMNAAEISEFIGIPMAACYRRIRSLKRVGMLREDTKTVSPGGKSVVTYRSALDRAKVVLHDGRLKVFMDVDGETSSDQMLL